ncbi:DNA-3-methyladenine glycosylase 1 [Roseovarius albus]|uniref:DNA-3-methyladenine glycosylase 1 n=1 Tax=Roseovarius albus TaxID=1247867 RepID=A0A1X6YUQ8_9RHOB|nr:DNA-3-methyladenine glycosylase I [Roseovarius albus]SLN29996.1 DNA-3-methyladenine glycosylase 1 [Roseovarius albus]
MSTLITGPDGQNRCSWCGDVPEFLPYHDNEWGYPVDDDTRLFEKLCLESFQSGLSWRTILNKRENFRAAFAGFDYREIMKFTDADRERLLNDPGIVRNRLKIDATINNAHRMAEMVEAEGSLAAFIWRYEPPAEELGEPQTASISPTSIALSKELKKRGWKFLGPTTIFAFMQAMGLINDHAIGCAMREKARKNRAAFTPPR